MIYFLSGAKEPREAMRHFFPEAWRDGQWRSTGVRRGPNGEEGVVVGLAPQLEITDVRYDADQAWAQCKGKDLRQAGVDAWCCSLSPEKSLRKNTVQGHLVEMDNGDWYMIPVARRFISEEGAVSFQNALPRALVLNDEGEWEYSNAHAHQELWQACRTYWDFKYQVLMAALKEEGADVDYDPDAPEASIAIVDMAEWCAIAIGTNYHMGRREMGALALVTEPIMNAILEAVIDMPSLPDLIKKNERPEPLNT